MNERIGYLIIEDKEAAQIERDVRRVSIWLYLFFTGIVVLGMNYGPSPGVDAKVASCATSNGETTCFRTGRGF